MSERLKEHVNNVSELISISAASADIKELLIEEEDNYIHNLRPQLHSILSARTGELKSSILRMLKALFPNALEEDKLSEAALVGSIDARVHKFVNGAAWNARNNLMILDEFTFARKTDWTPWLKLLEGQKFSKKVGLFAPEFNETDGDLYLKVKDGNMEVKTRFVAIIATMRRFESQRSDDFKAFITRCVPYRYELSVDEIDYVISGHNLFNDKKYNPKESITIPKSDYMDIKGYIKDRMPKNGKLASANFARIVADCIRIHAVKGNLDEDFVNKVINWKLDAFAAAGAYFGKDKMKMKLAEVFRQHGKEETA